MKLNLKTSSVSSSTQTNTYPIPSAHKPPGSSSIFACSKMQVLTCKFTANQQVNTNRRNRVWFEHSFLSVVRNWNSQTLNSLRSNNDTARNLSGWGEAVLFDVSGSTQGSSNFFHLDPATVWAVIWIFWDHKQTALSANRALYSEKSISDVLEFTLPADYVNQQISSWQENEVGPKILRRCWSRRLRRKMKSVYFGRYNCLCVGCLVV